MAPNVAASAARESLWQPKRRLTTLKAAAAFVDKVGFALAYPADDILAPSLYEGVAGPDAIAWRDGMGEAESLVWGWKDALPEAGLAWAGKLLAKRASVVAPDLLALLYAGAGDPDDHLRRPLSIEAHRIAQALAGGPLPTSELREIVGHKGRYERAVVELQRALLVSSAGVRPQPSGWPVILIDLTCHLFDVGGRHDPVAATSRYLATVFEATPRELTKAFGFPLADSRAHLSALVGRGEAVLDNGIHRRGTAIKL